MENHSRPPKEIPPLYTLENLKVRIRHRLNSFWELRVHRMYSYLGIPMKARSSEGREKAREERRRSYESYVDGGGLIEEVSKYS